MNTKTPPELAKELGIDPKRLRDWLRREYRRPESELGSRWYLDNEICVAARRHFAGS
jgi:hypothetical protein